ncbi:hypothetical protein ACIQLK_06805 [Microbacterium sp. NPDC091382]|uniref:hypothetical protein n=1 Tax=Microbacterium sp. NPDC091382 TaxID=3364210 RepID=UPI0037FD55C9
MALRSNARGRGTTTPAFVIVLGLVAGCAPAEPTEERGIQPIVGWANGGDIQSVTVGTCHGDPVATVEEDDRTATITVTSTKRSPGDSCLDALQVPPDRPLEDRAVIDGATGEVPPGIEG